MVIGKSVKRVARGAAVTAAAVIAVVFLTPNPAKAVSGGGAAASGLGSFAPGSALGAGAVNPMAGITGVWLPLWRHIRRPRRRFTTRRRPPLHAPERWDPYYRRHYAC
jgi:hypothetical protein